MIGELIVSTLVDVVGAGIMIGSEWTSVQVCRITGARRCRRINCGDEVRVPIRYRGDDPYPKDWILGHLIVRGHRLTLDPRRGATRLRLPRSTTVEMVREREAGADGTRRWGGDQTELKLHDGSGRLLRVCSHHDVAHLLANLRPAAEDGPERTAGA